MTETIVTAVCWSCKGIIDAGDKYCRHCGKGQGRYLPWYYGHAGIIILTFCALGPFSLFLVWRSPILSRAAKWIYTILIAVFTFWIVMTMHNIYVTAMEQLGNINLNM